MPRKLGGFQEGGRFLMSEDPMYNHLAATVALFTRISGGDLPTFGVFPGRKSTLDLFPKLQGYFSHKKLTPRLGPP